ncbi:hypothetical protein M501DRAFT_924291 [Patellaria atrata CBS 101060]|uniref:Uncharacterized protein n=1 Tax=Patellaria atrata CBS 101060 TaxID=1346257 RepID=A0A9P4SI45_9PEZI|nr:hypothetical protein M501DRAFT_924291 [Patellaria atrata CBS 101060]
MSTLRLTLRSHPFRPFLTTPSRTLYPPTRRLASSDYGSGSGDPTAEKPQKQGRNPSESLEHPGPPPPKVGQKSSENSSSGSSNTDSSKTTSSTSTDADKTQATDGKGEKAPQPKILHDSPPSGEGQPEDVRRHNEEMEKRSERAYEGVENDDTKNDKVGRGFWSGE